jgi:putative tryptophan/tyrosine transport system substrate-binding protein
MKRRELIAGLLGGPVLLAAAPALAAPAKTYRLGILVNTRDSEPLELLAALRDRGYVEGQNLFVEWRYSQGAAERWLPLARELVALKVDAIVVQTTPAALAAAQATSTIPIVHTSALDPVRAGLAESLAHPGRNITGVAIMGPEISAKTLSLVKETVPAASRVAVLWNSVNPALAPIWQAVEATGQSLGLALSSRGIREAQDLTGALAAMASQPPDMLLVLIDALVIQSLREIVEFAARERLPAGAGYRPFADLGGLMSYGPSPPATDRKAADYVDRVLGGEDPAGLPFEQPTKFELVINLKTAKALGLTVPPILLAQADEVIE